MAPPVSSVALLGGTGSSGPGLALRLALAGVPVHIGSRDPGRGADAAAEVSSRLAGLERAGVAPVHGGGNAAAAEAAECAMVCVPYDGLAGLLAEIAGALAGRVVVSTVVPMRWTRERGPEAVAVPEGSAAERAAALLPRSRVAAGFHSLSAVILRDPARGVDQDVVVCSDDDEAKAAAMALAGLLPGARGVDGGPLRYARHAEGLTVLLLSINRRHRGAHAGVRITDLP